MQRFVTIQDPLPAYRAGLGVALEDAGFVVEEPEDLSEWKRPAGACAALVSSAGDQVDEALGDVRRANPELLLVHLAPSPTAADHRDGLIDSGCPSVPRDAPVARIVETLQAAFEGDALIPLDVARELAADTGGHQPVPPMPEREVAWLAALAVNTPISSLAEDAGYSEREMYRQLRRLYQRLGAGNRTEALLTAARLGLVPPGPDPAG